MIHVFIICLTENNKNMKILGNLIIDQLLLNLDMDFRPLTISSFYPSPFYRLNILSTFLTRCPNCKELTDSSLLFYVGAILINKIIFP